MRILLRILLYVASCRDSLLSLRHCSRCRQGKEGSNVRVSLCKSRQSFQSNKSDYILGLAVKACDLAQLYNYSGFNSHVLPGRLTHVVKHKRSALYWITRRQWWGIYPFANLIDVSLAYILFGVKWLFPFYIHGIRIGVFFLATLKSLSSSLQPTYYYYQHKMTASIVQKWRCVVLDIFRDTDPTSNVLIVRTASDHVSCAQISWAPPRC